MLLNCLALSVLIAIAAATIHENRRGLVADSYLPAYGDSPPSKILSLKETQALFPVLHLSMDTSYVNCESDEPVPALPEDRYLTLYVTDGTGNNRDESFEFTVTPDSCSSFGRYLMFANKFEEWTGSDAIYHTGPRGIQLKKSQLNNDLEPGTSVLLYIPKKCKVVLKSVSRSFYEPPHGPWSFPETLGVSDKIPSGR